MINLTEKEKELIRLKSEGLTVKQIAKRLITSRAYAEQLIHALYNKTGCRNSGSLVAWGYQKGILQINREILPMEQEKAG